MYILKWTLKQALNIAFELHSAHSLPEGLAWIKVEKKRAENQFKPL